MRHPFLGQSSVLKVCWNAWFIVFSRVFCLEGKMIGREQKGGSWTFDKIHLFCYSFLYFLFFLGGGREGLGFGRFRLRWGGPHITYPFLFCLFLVCMCVCVFWKILTKPFSSDYGGLGDLLLPISLSQNPSFFSCSSFFALKILYLLSRSSTTPLQATLLLVSFFFIVSFFVCHSLAYFCFLALKRFPKEHPLFKTSYIAFHFLLSCSCLAWLVSCLCCFANYVFGPN